MRAIVWRPPHDTEITFSGKLTYTEIHGYRDTGIQGYRYTGIQEYRGTWV